MDNYATSKYNKKLIADSRCLFIIKFFISFKVDKLKNKILE